MTAEQTSWRARASDPSTANYRQGYDLEFVTPLDPQFECTICLLCQRDPYQTTCGHRFCKDCIQRWLRSERPKCPTDNTPLTEKHIFPDNFAKREIFNLKVRCPNKKNGCEKLPEVGQIDDHLQTCEYVTSDCPNKCNTKLLKKNIEQHVNEECLNRHISCTLCYEQFILSNVKEHFEICPMIMLKCEHCDTSLKRQELITHQSTDCLKAPVICPFHQIGCNEKIPRYKLEEHTTSSVHNHLNLMATSYTRLNNFVLNLLQSLEKIKNSPPASGSYASALSLGQVIEGPLEMWSDLTKSLSLPIASTTEQSSSGELFVSTEIHRSPLRPDFDSLDLKQQNEYLKQTILEQNSKMDDLQNTLAATGPSGRSCLV